jgi:hypothetical protein
MNVGWTLARPEFFRIKRLQQFGKHSHGANQHCFAGFNSARNTDAQRSDPTAIPRAPASGSFRKRPCVKQKDGLTEISLRDLQGLQLFDEL